MVKRNIGKEKNMTKTVRLNYPQWEGGMNPNYIIGNQIMNVIVPKTRNEVDGKRGYPSSFN